METQPGVCRARIVSETKKCVLQLVASRGDDESCVAVS